MPKKKKTKTKTKTKTNSKTEKAGKRSKFSTRLAKMDKNWKKGREGLPQVPPGDYILQLVSAVMHESAKGKLSIKRKHVVMSGKYKGKPVTDYLTLETDTAPFWVSRWIEVLGYEAPESLTEIEAAIAEITEAAPIVAASLTVTEDGGFVNLQDMKLADAEDAEGADGDGAGDEGGEEKSFDTGDDIVYTDGDDKTHEGTVVGPAEDDEDAIVIEVGDENWEVPIASVASADGDGDGDGSEDAAIEVGSKVTFKDEDGDDIEGEVVKLKKDKATVEEEDGDKHKVDLDDLTLVEADAGDGDGDDDEIKVGSSVTFADEDGDDVDGKVVQIKGKKATVEESDGDKHKVKLSKLSIISSEDTKDGDGDDDTKADLLAFAQAQGIDCDEDDDAEKLADAIKEYSYPEAELTEDEAKLLKSIDAKLTTAKKEKKTKKVKKSKK